MDALLLAFGVTIYRFKTNTWFKNIPLYLYESLQESLIEKEPNKYYKPQAARFTMSYAVLLSKQTHEIYFIQDIVYLVDEIFLLVFLPSTNSKLISHR